VTIRTRRCFIRFVSTDFYFRQWREWRAVAGTCISFWRQNDATWPSCRWPMFKNLSKSIKTGLKNANKLSIKTGLKNANKLSIKTGLKNANKLYIIGKAIISGSWPNATYVCPVFAILRGRQERCGPISGCGIFSLTFSIPELLRTKFPDLFPAVNGNFDSPELFPTRVGTLYNAPQASLHWFTGVSNIRYNAISCNCLE
jgi:hypothetical protein